MVTFLQSLTSGLLLGGVYSIVGVGLTLILGVVRIVNFAHGAFVMSAAYVAATLNARFGMDPYLSGLIIVPAFFLIGMGYYHLFLRRLVGASIMGQALFTIGVNLVIVAITLVMFGPDPQIVQLSYSSAVIHLGDLTIQVTRLVAFLAALATTLVLYVLLWRTDFGIKVRAAASDQTTAELMGIRTSSVHAAASGLSIACAAIGGIAFLPILAVSPTVAVDFTFTSFLIIVLGGLGNFQGALVGGVLIGITQTLGATYFDGAFAQMLTFVLFVVVLIVRPTGIFKSTGSSAWA